MNILVRINLALVALFLLAMAAIGIEASSMLRANARQQGAARGGADDGQRARDPRVHRERDRAAARRPMQSAFLPQSVPSYAATQNFLKLREQHPEYAYKEATLNPTNPRDRAADWEADIVYGSATTPR